MKFVITELSYLSTPRSSTLERFIITHIKEFLVCYPYIKQEKAQVKCQA